MDISIFWIKLSFLHANTERFATLPVFLKRRRSKSMTYHSNDNSHIFYMYMKRNFKKLISMIKMGIRFFRSNDWFWNVKTQISKIHISIARIEFKVSMFDHVGIHRFFSIVNTMLNDRYFPIPITFWNLTTRPVYLIVLRSTHWRWKNSSFSSRTVVSHLGLSTIPEVRW